MAQHSGKCGRCGQFHFQGKRARRKHNKLMSRCIRKNVRRLAEYIDLDVMSRVMSELGGSLAEEALEAKEKQV